MNRKYLFLMTAMAMFLFGACKGKTAEHHHDHDHEHEHEMAEAHDHDHDHEHDHDHDHDHEHDGHSDEIIFTPAQAAAAGLTTETVKAGSFSGVMHVSGRITPSNSDETTVVAGMSGTVHFANAMMPGKRLAYRANIAEIRTQTVTGSSSVGTIKRAYEAALNNYERHKKLAEEQIVSLHELETARVEYESALAEYQAIEDGSGDKFYVVAPAEGTLRETYVKNGEFVEAGQPIARITSSRMIQLQADVPENFYGRVRDVVAANFRPSYTDKVYSTKELGVSSVTIGQVPESGSFYLPVVFQMNGSADLIPGAFADIWLLEKDREDVISIPTSSLTEEQGVYFVYIRLDEEGYRKTEVKIGAGNGIRTEILSGLEPGQEVVTNGAYQVKLASFKGEVPGHTHNH